MDAGRGKSTSHDHRKCDGIDVHQPSCDLASFANTILVMTALEVYTDSGEAVGAVIRPADVGRPVNIDTSSQGQSTGVAEGAVRKIKDAVAALQNSIREQGVDTVDGLTHREIKKRNKKE